jgi:hypothetical protein
MAMLILFFGISETEKSSPEALAATPQRSHAFYRSLLGALQQGIPCLEQRRFLSIAFHKAVGRRASQWPQAARAVALEAVREI